MGQTSNTGSAGSRAGQLVGTALAFIWLAVIHLPTVGLTAYGIWLGLKAHLLWGLAISLH